MEAFLDQTTFTVSELTCHPDEDGFVVGDPSTGVFLSIPREGLDILKWIGEGLALKKVKEKYFHKYEETPELDDFLTMLEDSGFVRQRLEAKSEFKEEGNAKPQLRYHFEQISQTFARRVFTPTAYLAYGALIVAAIIAWISLPAVRPHRSDLVFTQHIALTVLVFTLLSFVRIFLHEMAHLLAARSFGVPSRLGIGNRLWVLVAETDMTGIWSIPRSKRYLPFLAGPMFDVLASAVLVLSLAAVNMLELTLPETAVQLTRALLLATLLGIIWQCYFFIRTDFYYVFANFFNCKNLMEDTVHYLQNIIASRLGRPLHDLSAIPLRELRIIKYFCLVWIIGRALAFTVLFTIGIPTLISYASSFAHSLRHEHYTSYAFWDALTTMGISTIIMVTGFTLWIKSMFMKTASTQGRKQ